MFGVVVHSYQEHEPLEYEVDVNAIIIPIFAINGQGEPVFDLKKEEIELFIDKKLQQVAEFSVYKVEDKKRQVVEGGEVRTVSSDDRVNIMILDSISNSEKGMRRAKKIASSIVNESPVTDAFVIIESKPKSGFRYIIGPETNKKRLTEAIKDTNKVVGDRFSKASRNIRRMGSNVISSGERYARGQRLKSSMGSWAYRAHVFETATRNMVADRNEYHRDLDVFFNSISQMKYALKTITQPKHVFIISGGVPNSSLGRELVRYYKFMGDAAKAINYGGSMLYMINPVPVVENSTPHSLKIMARESGGKYFSGNSIDEIVEKVKKSTQAYYELAFFPPNKGNEKMNINLKCKREDVVLNTVNYAEKGKPYFQMEPLQKKLFALSVVTGGSWSRIVGDVKTIKYKKIKSSDSKFKKVKINIPGNIIEKNLEIFVVNIEPESMKANIGIRKMLAMKNLKIEIPVEKGKVQFFVIIEPRKPLCLYNRVN